LKNHWQNFQLQPNEAANVKSKKIQYVQFFTFLFLLYWHFVESNTDAYIGTRATSNTSIAAGRGFGVYDANTATSTSTIPTASTTCPSVNDESRRPATCQHAPSINSSQRNVSPNSSSIGISRYTSALCVRVSEHTSTSHTFASHGRDASFTARSSKFWFFEVFLFYFIECYRYIRFSKNKRVWVDWYLR
jgi:hypothetical protein